MLTRTMLLSSAAAVIFAAAVPAAERVPGFSAKPTVKSAGGKAEISFSVRAATDVEVAILDAKGQVVRHLAAGLLGPKAPAPLKKDSLSQELSWDFKDDLGRKVPAGQYKVRVGLGLDFKFDRVLRKSPNHLGAVRGLAVGAGGELFVLNLAHHLHGGFGSPLCSVYGHDAKYKRTIMPYRASAFPDRAGDFGVLDLGAGGKYPRLQNSVHKSIYPFIGETCVQRPLVMPDGRLVMTMRVKGKGAVLVAVDGKDGGMPKSGTFGPVLGANMSGYACLALAPDGETIYLSGTGTTKRYRPVDKWKHAVFRVKWGETSPTPLIGTPDTPGKGEKGLKEPQGVAVDKDGNIYVADWGNNRVAVFDPKARLLAELPVEKPYMVSVHRKSGAVYVLGKGDPPTQLVKFRNMKDPKPVYEQRVPRIHSSHKNKRLTYRFSVFALDDSGAEPVLWVGASNVWNGFRLYRIAEKGGKLGDFEEKGRKQGFRHCRELQVDRNTEEIYYREAGDSGEGMRQSRVWKIDGTSGKPIKKLRTDGTGSHFTLGLDGNIYVVRGRRILKYDTDFKPAAFKGSSITKTELIKCHRYGFHLAGRGVAAGPDGSVYVLHENVPNVHTRYGVSKWGPNGKLLKENLVGQLSAGAHSLRTDYRGNVYVGDPVKPAGQLVPSAFKGKLKLDKRKKGTSDNHYAITYGSILKFGPGGGAGVGSGVGGRKALRAFDVKLGVKGDLWQYFGVSKLPSHHGAGYNHYVTHACACEGMRFDVDGYGRVFAPDAARFRVVVLDTGGNQIGTFGRYGNADDSLPVASGGKTQPGIHFGWVSSAAVSDRAAYVSDILNRRLMRIGLSHKHSESRSIAAP